ncbi:MAG: hypothetical protein A2V99_00080 [Spirochaetes bacterium RBG_16_67_19]|nr:MAG: hypothetical protein A2V99_00080 [Spirochaetes bacterium RBG_16_67_19]
MSAVFHGPYAAMVTPFDEGAELSEPRLAAYCEFLIGQGIGGLFAFGTTGEWPLLAEEERAGGARALVKQAAGRVPVIVHAGAHGTAQAIRLARAAREAGAAAASLISPPFYPLDPEALQEHFVAVARAVPGFPLFLYNLPEYAGNDITPGEQLRVLEHGYRLRVVETRQPYVPLSVDTPEDLERARELAGRLEAAT